ncbi:MAG: porin family protein [Alcanivorax sp.]|nr:porin family protein [Alcanivorax sp.]
MSAILSTVLVWPAMLMADVPHDAPHASPLPERGFVFHTSLSLSETRAGRESLDDWGTEAFRDNNLGFTIGGAYRLTRNIALDVARLELDADRVWSELGGQNIYGHGWRFTLDGTWALNNVAGVYGRAGMWRWNMRVRPDFGRGRRSISGTDPVVEAGIRFGPRASVNLDIGYGWYPMDDLDTRVVSIGLRYHLR